jgi:uroporphyrin-III C-methyltransferase
MGVHNLKFISAELIAGGMNPETSAAVIEQGTVIGPRYIKSPLVKLFDRVQEENLRSPAIVVIGSVVDFQVEACSPKPAEVTFPIPI